MTEKTGSQPRHWGRLMSAQLTGAAKSAYDGPGSERSAATEVAKMYEERMFDFRTKKRVLASQPLTIQGHKGWLVSDYLTYRRPGLTATGDVVAVALVDTGKKTPGVLFMSVPNTSKSSGRTSTSWCARCAWPSPRWSRDRRDVRCLWGATEG